MDVLFCFIFGMFICMYFPLDFNMYHHLLPKINFVLVSYTYFVLKIIKIYIYILLYRGRTHTLHFRFLQYPIPVVIYTYTRSRNLVQLAKFWVYNCCRFYPTLNHIGKKVQFQKSKIKMLVKSRNFDNIVHQNHEN